MRKHKFKSSFFKFFIMFIIIFLISSCSNDNDNSSFTFLETYNNTIWKFDNPIYGIGYVEFKNNLKDPLSSWVPSSDNSNSCLYYSSVGLYYPSIGLESFLDIYIIENSKDKFVIRVPVSNDLVYTFSYLKTGDNMLLEIRQFYKSELFIEIYNGVKSNVNVGSLITC